MKQDALYWRYFYKFQSLLARDTNYLEMIAETEPSSGNGVRVESSLPFTLNHLSHHMAYLSRGDGSYPSDMMKYSDCCKWITLNQHPWIKEIRDEEGNKLIVHKVTKIEYHYNLSKLPIDKRSFLDDVVEADNYYLVLDSSETFVGGFATTERGYLTGLFSLRKGIGKRLFQLRLNQAYKDLGKGVKQYRIFCTGEYLREFYEGLGFKVTETVTWEDKFAPKGWDYESKGRPNLYNLEKEVGV